jgi:hypothetical protein
MESFGLPKLGAEITIASAMDSMTRDNNRREESDAERADRLRREIKEIRESLLGNALYDKFLHPKYSKELVGREKELEALEIKMLAEANAIKEEPSGTGGAPSAPHIGLEKIDAEEE